MPELPAALIFAAFGWRWLWARLPGLTRTIPLAAALLVVTLALFVVADVAGPFLYPRPTEYRAAGLALHGTLPEGSHMLARKRQTPFYAGAVWEWLPFAELDGVLAYAAEHNADYIVIDAFTVPILRPQVVYLLDPANAPPVLTVVYYDVVQGVVIYRIDGAVLR